RQPPTTTRTSARASRTGVQGEVGVLARKWNQADHADGASANETRLMAAVAPTAAARPRQSRRENSQATLNTPGVIFVSQPTADQPPRPVAASTTAAVMMPVTCPRISSGTVNSMIGAAHLAPSGARSQTKATASTIMQIAANQAKGRS